jgi:hypothetical protein
MYAKQDPSPRSTAWAPRALGIAATVAASLGGATAARAEMREPPPPPPAPQNYVTAVLGTTLFYKPNTGSSSGWQKDIGPAVGYGRLITPTIAVELDVGMVFIKDEYSTTLLVPGVVWSFSTHVYAAMRFLVPVDPEANLVLYPGIGVVQAFSNGIAVSLELNPSSAVGRGKPDFALPLNLGVLYSF